ncbi:STAS domain-containing protein [Xylophilus sp.]|uniref:STAS domain-containing protein n=1 Tax=Xylophilus sp. TaxID=2653893 RepID=UPI002D7E9C37|nr:STAS domain-containing protein [Xylophilus sp.]
MAEQKNTGRILIADQASILKAWTEQQFADTGRRELLSESELAEQSRAFLALLAAALSHGGEATLSGPHWDDIRASLSALSRGRALSGFTPSETATFVFSLKKPLFESLGRAYADQPRRLAEETWKISLLLDRLGLLTVDAYQQGREQVIIRQQQELLELSTPVIRLWAGIVAVPLIGTLDSERTQVVMESLLEAIVDNEATIAIIDITGVPTVDTLVAQHLLKTIAAARLMGAECILSGIRPQIAQTIVHLGVDLGDVGTKSTLADALRLAFQKRSLVVSAAQQRTASQHGA